MGKDYLDVMKVPQGQEWFLFSQLLSIADDEANKIRHAYGIRFLGAYPTLDAAKEAAKQLRDENPYHHIMVGQSGYWLGLNPSSEDPNIEQEYMNEELNRIMKNHLEHEKTKEKEFKERKEEMVRKEKLIQADKQFEFQKKLLEKKEKNGKITALERKFELAKLKKELEEEKKRISNKAEIVQEKQRMVQEARIEADEVKRQIERLESVIRKKKPATNDIESELQELEKEE